MSMSDIETMSLCLHGNAPGGVGRSVWGEVNLGFPAENAAPMTLTQISDYK